MTDQTPIERAAEALRGKPLTGRRELNPEQADDAARSVFEAIDTDALADVLSTLTTCDGQPHASELHHRQARAVKNYLTGGNQ